MKLANLLVLIAVVLVSQVSGADWEYPAGGPTGHGEHSVGKSGNFHTYNTLTKDGPEKVILWYAKQLGLKDDNRLVEHAKAGFENLDKNKKNTINEVDYIVVRDTNTEKWGALIFGTLSPEHANVHIFIRPENDPKNDITISIAQTAKGTLISVIQSVPSEGDQNVENAN